MITRWNGWLFYCKPTHTPQYLNWDYNHHLEQKRYVVRTLLAKAETVLSDLLDYEEDVRHVEKALSVNGYKKWSFEIPQNVKTADTSHDHTQGEMVNPVHLCGGGITASPVHVVSTWCGIFTTDHSTLSDPCR